MSYCRGNTVVYVNITEVEYAKVNVLNSFTTEVAHLWQIILPLLNIITLLP